MQLLAPALLSLALAAPGLCAPRPDDFSPQHLEPVYHPQPHHEPQPSYHAPKHKYKAPPKPYNFAYGVNDPYQGIDFGQTEESDGKSVQGSYSVQLPDGRKQIVTYVADHDQGYHAEVSYEGKAQYPPKSEHPPFVVKPQKGYAEHAPAPTYH